MKATFETVTRIDGSKFTRIHIAGEKDHTARLIKDKQEFERAENLPTCAGLIAQHGGNLPD